MAATVSTFYLTAIILSSWMDMQLIHEPTSTASNLTYCCNLSWKFVATKTHDLSGDRVKKSLSKWTKHGQTVLLIPDHERDPPLNITIFMDIAVNPGPSSNPMSDERDSINLSRSTSVSNTTDTGRTAVTRSKLYRYTRHANRTDYAFRGIPLHPPSYMFSR